MTELSSFIFRPIRGLERTVGVISLFTPESLSSIDNCWTRAIVLKPSFCSQLATVALVPYQDNRCRLHVVSDKVWASLVKAWDSVAEQLLVAIRPGAVLHVGGKFSISWDWFGIGWVFITDMNLGAVFGEQIVGIRTHVDIRGLMSFVRQRIIQ